MSGSRTSCRTSEPGGLRSSTWKRARTRILSRRELRQLAVRIEEWQEHIQRLAREADLDIVRVGLDRWEMETALVNSVAERRLRKV